MEDIKRCMRCVLPSSLPSVEFDSDGVCNQCRRYDKLFGNWENRRAQREKELEALFQRARRMNRRYDCLVGLSGGKDSTYVLYVCDRIYKLRCLCVTFDNGFMSQHARANISNALRATNADHIFYTVNRNLLLKLYRLFLSKTGDFCSVCMRCITMSMWAMAMELGIPLVISGAGQRVAYLSTIPELFQGGNIIFFRNVLRGEQIENDTIALLRDLRRGLVSRVLGKLGRTMPIKAFSSWIPPRPVDVYDYVFPSVEEIYTILKHEMGWTEPKPNSEHMDCLLHEIPFYIHTLKFAQLTSTTIHHSHLIRLGRMTRQEAQRIENKKLENPEVPSMLEPFLEEIDMTRDEFASYVRDWRRVYKYRMGS